MLKEVLNEERELDSKEITNDKYMLMFKTASDIGSRIETQPFLTCLSYMTFETFVGNI
jgi:hypothetical protein